MLKLIVATRNQGKLHELTSLLGTTPLKVESLEGIVVPAEVPEPGETFTENAVHKAVEYSRRTEDLTLADDSGLEVVALGGAPGVRSARYGGPGQNDEKRCRLLLKEMEKVAWEERKARFVCVLALARGGALIRSFEGTVEGLIAFEPRGKNGFGYDPIFYYPPLARTFGELKRAQKDRVSHRARALAEFRKFIDRMV